MFTHPLTLHKQLLVFTLLFAGYMPLLNAQEPLLKHYNTENGLPSNEIYQVIQDEKGHLLLATDRGAVRFDGYSFENIPMTASKASYPVYYVYRGPSGKIYFTGAQGIVYQYDQQKMTADIHDNALGSKFIHSGILVANSLAENQDTLWANYDYVQNLIKNNSVGYTTGNKSVAQLVTKDGFYFDLQKKFYYQHLSKSFHPQGEQVQIRWPDKTITHDSILLDWPTGYVRRLFHEKVDGYDVFSIGRRILIYQNKKKIKEQLLPDDVLSMSQLKDGTLAIGFEATGVSYYQFLDTALQKKQTFLSGLSVTSVFQDHQGGTWFSTYEAGIYYQSPAQITHWKTREPLFRMAQDKGKVYVAYQRNHQIAIYSDNDKEAELYWPNTNDLFLNFSFNEHHSLMGLSTKNILHVETRSEKPATDFYLMAAGPGVVFTASGGRGLVRQHATADGSVQKIINTPRRVLSMCYDQQGTLWMGTLEGLYKYADGQVHSLTSQNKVFADRIIGIHELQGIGVIVASLSNGVAIIQKNKIVVLDQSNGLDASFIHVTRLYNNQLWISTNNGLWKASITNETVQLTRYGTESGLSSLNVEDFIINNDWLYIKRMNQLEILRLYMLETKIPPGKIYLVWITAKGNAVDFSKPGNFTRQHTDLSFEFNSPNLAAASTQVYQYLLQGYDRNWKSTQDRIVNYTNLPAGKYVFRVRTYNKGNTSEEVSYSFSIAPALWEKPWFITLAVLLLLTAIVLLFRLRLRMAKRKNQLLLDLAESQQKSLLQIMNPHFIYNLLNTIQGTILKNDNITSASILSRFAKLMRLSVEMGNERWVTLEKESEFLKKYTELEILRSGRKFSFHIHIDRAIPASRMQIPTMVIQPFVENAIKHGVMHLTSLHGKIEVSFFFENQSLICVIDDNGVGREVSSLINKGNTHQSSGISITLKRLSLLHQENKTRYLYRVDDKNDIDHQSSGTSVLVSLPYKMLS